jgi:hypothetical protein
MGVTILLEEEEGGGGGREGGACYSAWLIWRGIGQDEELQQQNRMRGEGEEKKHDMTMQCNDVST